MVFEELGVSSLKMVPQHQIMLECS